ncbi:SRPBCC family protein [Streptacidiphilus sp. P02-A3a]|uniref:SRPBCC family protein n=1 Tax=Streptacidiphilus sp. P02-A3a TaxID=2704468 RepID=UPI001CDC0F1C|nr:SRPBCC family protein [Streptacidiphilus sp. P02-A3a]
MNHDDQNHHDDQNQNNGQNHNNGQGDRAQRGGSGHRESPDSIEREVLINAPAERVWRVLTEAAFLGSWFGSGEPAEIELRPGGKLLFDHGAHGALLARIEQVEPPHLLSFRWSQGRPGEEPVANRATLVELRLTPVATGTRLRVLESGFAGLAIARPAVQRHRQPNDRGWAGKLNELREHLERQAA